MLSLLVAAVVAQQGPTGSTTSPPPGPPPPRGGPVKTYRAPFTTSAPVLDGKLDDAAWSAAPWTDDFVDIEGPSKPTPRYRTRAKMTWDERCLYVAAELEDPDVWATLRHHDGIVFHDDDFELFVDPDGDGRAYYELETNCYPTVFDLFLARTYRDGGPAVHSWNCEGLVTKVDVRGTVDDPRDEDEGWTLEWAIPWKSLVPPSKDDAGRELPPVDEERRRAGAPPKNGETWRIDFSRVQWKHNFEELDEHGRRIGPKGRPRAPLTPNGSGEPATRAPIGKYEKKKGEKEDNWVWSPQWVVDMHLPDRWGEVTFVRERASAPPTPTSTTTPTPIPKPKKDEKK